MVQLLQCLDAAAAAAFTLCCVDDGPCGVVALTRAVAALGEVEDDGDEHGEGAEVFEYFEQRPVAKRPCGPLQIPFEFDPGKSPGRVVLGSQFGPFRRTRGFSYFEHAVEIL